MMYKMAKMLYITANPKPIEESFSLSVGKAFLDAYRQGNPDAEIKEIDVYNIDLPFVDADVLSGWGKLQSGKAFDELTGDEKTKVGRITQFTDEFLSADIYVFVTPLWNLSIPPKMKAYLDTICVAEKTFKYTEQGPVGLLTDKKAVHIQARGGIYSHGPAKEFEHGDSYIRSLLAFLGIPSISSIIIEGAAQDPSKADEIKAKAIKEAQEVAKRIGQ